MLCLVNPILMLIKNIWIMFSCDALFKVTAVSCLRCLTILSILQILQMPISQHCQASNRASWSMDLQFELKMKCLSIKLCQRVLRPYHFSCSVELPKIQCFGDEITILLNTKHCDREFCHHAMPDVIRIHVIQIILWSWRWWRIPLVHLLPLSQIIVKFNFSFKILFERGSL